MWTSFIEKWEKQLNFVVLVQHELIRIFRNSLYNFIFFSKKIWQKQNWNWNRRKKWIKYEKNSVLIDPNEL